VKQPEGSLREGCDARRLSAPGPGESYSHVILRLAGGSALREARFEAERVG
jgi:hypothetical protein